jgi:tetratricopeptide (TPR) repeat protein
MAASASPDPPPSVVPGTARSARWQVRLLGAVEAQGPGPGVTHFPSRSAVQLLARLALAPERMHPREELVELLWPGVALDVGRNRLRQVLHVLKGVLDADAEAPVVVADRLGVRVAAGALACDAVDFERHLRAGRWDLAERLYRGELLPGFYDDWVIEERGRLAALAERLQSMPQLPPSPLALQARGAAPAPGQIPAYWTRLFGTEINATRLRDLVRHQRLVTVFGAGGSGKTRLAVEAARALAEPAAWAPAGDSLAPDFAQVVFVSLVDCSDAARALDAVASALRVQGRDLLQGIAGALAGQRALLLLDNYEQLAGRAEALLQRLLTDNATLHLLVTSRQRLNIDGEQIFELAGLPLPPRAGEPASRPADEAGAGQAAVALFIDRARAAAPAFATGPAQDAAIAELVRLLAGMPLAIELAASQMRSHTPSELLALLQHGRAPMLDMLAREGEGDAEGGAGDGDADGKAASPDGGGSAATPGMARRHASMRHVVAWSWQQLGPPLAQVMQALATFAAPASHEAVAAVAQLGAGAARERLQQLRDQSLLLTQRDATDTPRHVLLQPVREFVIESTPPAAGLALRDRLRRWLLDFARQHAARGHAAIAEIEAELPQVYAAILDAVADGPAAQLQVVELAVALRRHWEIDTRAGLPLAVMEALQAALPAVADAGLRCELCVLLGFSCGLAGLSAQALALSDEGVALAADPRRRAHALLRRVQVVMFSPSDQSTVDAPLAEAVALAQQAGDLEAQALAMRMQFLVAVNRDDDSPRAEALALAVQQLWERVGHRRNAYSGLMDRASCWMRAGRLDEAATALAACEQAALQERYPTGHIMSSWQLGRASLKLRRADEALAAFRRCLRGSWQHKRLAYVADALVQLPGGLAFTGQAEDAARLMGFASAHWQRQFGSFYKDLDRDIRPTRRWLRQRLGAVRFEALRLEGLGLTLAQAVALGLGGDDSR